MRITGGQITGGVTFTSPEPLQNQLWYWSEGADFQDLDGKSFPYDSDENVSTGLYGFQLNFDTGQMSHPLAATSYNFQTLNEAQALTYFNNLPIDSRIDFAQGYNEVSINNFPDPSTRIPNPAYWSNVYATLSYAGNASIANVSSQFLTGNTTSNSLISISLISISFYVKSPDPSLSIRQVMEQTFYDNANNSGGHDYSVVSNEEGWPRYMTMIHYPGNAVPYITIV